MKKFIFTILLFSFIGISEATRIAVIDGFKELKYYDPETAQEYSLYHGEEVINIIKAIHPHAEILKYDYLEESRKKFKLSMDLKQWQEACEFTLAELIVKAVDEGAKIINISLKIYQGTQVLKDAVEYAWDRGVIVCWAAGNEHSMAPFNPPDNYRDWFPGALIVGAVDYEGNISKFSHTGEIYTWGENVNCEILKLWRLYLTGNLQKIEFDRLIKETLENSEFTSLGFPLSLLKGTSFATPIISGLLGEIFEYKDFNNLQEAIEFLFAFSRKDSEGRNIILFEDLIPMYKTLGFEIDSVEIPILSSPERNYLIFSPQPF